MFELLFKMLSGGTATSHIRVCEFEYQFWLLTAGSADMHPGGTGDSLSCWVSATLMSSWLLV